MREWRSEYQPQHRAHKLNATPSWADIDSIKAIYKECLRISDETGVMHHVDHVIPLKGKTVCGLHVHYNLQILVWRDNIAKGNRLTDKYNAFVGGKLYERLSTEPVLDLLQRGWYEARYLLSQDGSYEMCRLPIRGSAEQRISSYAAPRTN